MSRRPDIPEHHWLVWVALAALTVVDARRVRRGKRPIVDQMIDFLGLLARAPPSPGPVHDACGDQALAPSLDQAIVFLAAAKRLRLLWGAELRALGEA